MRTHIRIGADLVREALGRIKTKRAAIHQALLAFAVRRRRLDPRELEGSDLLDPDYDHKALRDPPD